MKLTLVFTLFLVLAGVMMTSAADCVCTRELNPVCGTNGKTYDNPCLAKCENVCIAKYGKCKKIW